MEKCLPLTDNSIPQLHSTEEVQPTEYSFIQPISDFRNNTTFYIYNTHNNIEKSL